MKNLKRSLFAELVFYCLIIVLPFEELISFGGISLTKLAGLIFLIASLSDIKFFYGSIPTVFFAFFLYSSIGMSIDVFYFPLDFDSFNTLIGPLLMCLLMIVTYNLAIGGKSYRIVMTLFVSSLLYAIAQFFELGGQATRTGERVSGIMLDRVGALHTDQNFAACYISMCVIAGLVYIANFASNRWGYRLVYGAKLMPTRWLYSTLALASSIIGFYAIIKTSSRGGILALFFGILCIGLTARKLTKKIKYAFFAIFLLGIMSMAIMDNTLFNARITSSIETGETAGRTEIWEEAIRLCMDSPIYGYGNRMKEYKIGKRFGKKRYATHNLYLSVLLGSGFSGLCLFLYFYFRAFKTIWLHKTAGVNPIVFPWFMMSLAASFTLNIEIAKWFWTILALCLAAGSTGGGRQPGVKAGGKMKRASSMRNESNPDILNIPA